MNIQRFSTITNISAHTLRYYEKIGLLKQISRNTSGHRFFTQKDIVWVEFIKRLKDTGMPLNEILQYAELRAQGDVTAQSRMDILKAHSIALETKIAAEQRHLQMLKQKIKHYNEIINL